MCLNRIFNLLPKLVDPVSLSNSSLSFVAGLQRARAVHRGGLVVRQRHLRRGLRARAGGARAAPGGHPPPRAPARVRHGARLQGQAEDERGPRRRREGAEGAAEEVQVADRQDRRLRRRPAKVSYVVPGSTFCKFGCSQLLL